MTENKISTTILDLADWQSGGPWPTAGTPLVTGNLRTAGVLLVAGSWPTTKIHHTVEYPLSGVVVAVNDTAAEEDYNKNIKLLVPTIEEDKESS